MNVVTDETENLLLEIFQNVFKRKIIDNHFCVDELEEWDSLSHIYIIMEIERSFSIDIDPEEIADLYTDFSTIVHFVKDKIGGKKA